MILFLVARHSTGLSSIRALPERSGAFARRRAEVVRLRGPAKFSGYYGILLAIWSEYGGGRYSAEPWEASDLEQAVIAHKLYTLYGLSPWECAGIVGLL